MLSSVAADENVSDVLSQDELPMWMYIIWPLVFFALFAGFWIATIYFVSRVSGWGKLAQLYKSTEGRPANASLSSGTFRWLMNYNAVLYLGTKKEGLHLSLMRIFAVGHPDLLIPWSKIEEGKSFSILFMSMRELHFDGVLFWCKESVWKRICEQRGVQE